MGKIAKLEPKQSDDLEVLYPKPKTLELGGVEFTVSRFRLKQLAESGELIARLMQCIEFDKIQNMSETININPAWLGQALFGQNMSMLMRLLQLGTGAEKSDLEALEVPEAMQLAEAVTEVCVIPAILSAATPIKKLSDKLKTKPGPTSSSDSEDQESDSEKLAS